MATNVLQIRGLNQHYGESHTLWDLDIDVPPQQCTVVMGRNGVGKSTLMRSVMGIVPIKTGEMLYRGKAIQRMDASIRAHLGIGYVPQGRQIFPLLTVEENLKLGLRARADGASSIPSQVFARFPVLKEMSHRRGGDLSGGQQQQLAIARALVTDPSLLILDEPTEGIQPNIVAEIALLIRSLIDELALSVLLVEQRLSFARKVGDSFVVLDRGRCVAKGEMRQLSDELVTQYLTV